MKVLFLSNLFPDARNPDRGIYNVQLVQHLSRLCEIRVVAPRPARGVAPFWFPKKEMPRKQDEPFSPIFPPAAYIPKIGSRFNHLLMAKSLARNLRQIRATFPFEVVLASWIYPDVCAVAELVREDAMPFVAIAQGSDVHQYLRNAVRRKIILKALSSASAIVARSKDLSNQLEESGVARDKLRVIYNGVDCSVFRPGDRAAARRHLKLPDDSVVLLFVGNLLEIKNPLLLVEAHADLCRRMSEKKIFLLMVGSGPLDAAVRERSHRLGNSEHVRLAGAQPSENVARYMQAADLLCVPSRNEGVPNVILEALACGLPIVARKVGGIAEVITDDCLGMLVDDSNAAALSAAMTEVLKSPFGKEQRIEHAHKFSWDRAANEYFKLLQSAISPAQ